jgi:hypothetical protein
MLLKRGRSPEASPPPRHFPQRGEPDRATTIAHPYRPPSIPTRLSPASNHVSEERGLTIDTHISSDVESDHSNPYVVVPREHIESAIIDAFGALVTLEETFDLRMVHLGAEARDLWTLRIQEANAEVVDAMRVPFDEMDDGGFMDENDTVREWFGHLSELKWGLDDYVRELRATSDE